MHFATIITSLLLLLLTSIFPSPTTSYVIPVPSFPIPIPSSRIPYSLAIPIPTSGPRLAGPLRFGLPPNTIEIQFVERGLNEIGTAELKSEADVKHRTTAHHLSRPILPNSTVVINHVERNLPSETPNTHQPPPYTDPENIHARPNSTLIINKRTPSNHTTTTHHLPKFALQQMFSSHPNSTINSTLTTDRVRKYVQSLLPAYARSFELPEKASKKERHRICSRAQYLLVTVQGLLHNPLPLPGVTVGPILSSSFEAWLDAHDPYAKGCLPRLDDEKLNEEYRIAYEHEQIFYHAVRLIAEGLIESCIEYIVQANGPHGRMPSRPWNTVALLSGLPPTWEAFVRSYPVCVDGGKRE